MSTFKSAIGVCGLSQKEAAEFLDVRLDTIKSWSVGRGNPPLGVWLLLASLLEQIQDAADNASGVMALEGIDPRAYNSIQADIPGNELPIQGAIDAAGAIALLQSVQDAYGPDDDDALDAEG